MRTRRFNLNEIADLDALGCHDEAEELRREGDLRELDARRNYWADVEAHEREQAAKRAQRRAKKSKQK